MTTLPGTTSGLQWKEGTEGLLFGELFLGGMASTYLGRGRSRGYGLYFTDQRVIGVRMRLLAQALLAPYLIEIRSHGWNQHQKLRDLVINFASREPRVRAVEYPYGQ